MAEQMDINQIIIIAIVVAAGIIVLFLLYFLISFLIKKSKGKKDETLFNPSSLVEEDSLVKIMEEKRNVEFKKTTNNSFVENPSDVKILSNEETAPKIVNPFGIDMSNQNTPTNNDNSFNDIPNNNNKFIK